MPERSPEELEPKPIKAKAVAKDDKLDALLDRLNKKDSTIQLCRGC